MQPLRSPSLLSVLLLVTFAAQAQDPPSRLLHSTSRLVSVPTLVQSPSGDLVTTLTAADFRLTDNGTPQAVSLDHLERQPLAVLVLLQIGGAAARQLPSYTGLGTMLEAIVGASAHRVSLVTFDSRPEETWDFTPHIEDLNDGFTHPGAGDDGAAILDAVSFGIDALRTQPPQVRRILLLVSQQHDAGSQTHLDEIVRRLGESNVTIFSVTFSPEKTWLKDEFTQPRHESPPYRLSPDYPLLLHTFSLSTPLGVALRALRADTAAQAAALSGGEVFQFGSKSDLETKLNFIANNVHNRYALSFSPSSPPPGHLEPGFHTLHVSVPAQPTFHVAARTGYWLEPDSPSH